MSNFDRDMDRFKKECAASIWNRRDSSQANEDAIKALRAAIVKECQDLINQHIAQADKGTIPPEDPAAIGNAKKALIKAREAMEGLKR